MFHVGLLHFQALLFVRIVGCGIDWLGVAFGVTRVRLVWGSCDFEIGVLWQRFRDYWFV